MNNQIIPTSEPFFLQGSKTGILLIHGFTGTPKDMRWMGEYFNQRGLTCLGIRLNGHATDLEDMRRSRWTDWTASVQDGYHLLRGSVDRVFLVGLSMGGVLSLLMSTKLDVAGVVAMSTPYQLPNDHPLWALRLYSIFFRDNPKSKETPGASWFDKAAYAEHVSYPQYPMRSVVEMKLLLNEMQAALPEVRKPVMLIHSKDDLFVLPENMERIYAGLVNASDKTKLYVTGSGHVVTRDAARHQVFEVARNFINHIEK
ncbi:MAG: alpha/beta fold hydrolase [Anaerolineales bacterium]|nr:alpha/beta fold hydrolase [Anaerolineales bacterium]